MKRLCNPFNGSGAAAWYGPCRTEVGNIAVPSSATEQTRVQPVCNSSLEAVYPSEEFRDEQQRCDCSNHDWKGQLVY